MIVLLGATGYVGQAFQRGLAELNEVCLPLSRKTCDYTRYDRSVCERACRWLREEGVATRKPWLLFVSFVMLLLVYGLNGRFRLTRS